MSSISKSQNYSAYPGIVGLGMTVLRIALSFVCIRPAINQNSDFFVATMVFLVMLFDIYDGKLFRNSSLNYIELWRKIRRVLDSCGDRLCIQLVCVPIVLTRAEFAPFYCIICLKELLSATVCLHSFSKGYIIYPSNVSRLCTFFVGLTVISYLLNAREISLGCASILLIGAFFSCFSYLKKSSEIKKGGLTEGKDYEVIPAKWKRSID